MTITIIGAGIAGLTAALELTKQGLKVEVLERGTRLGIFACSSLAGGMISPWCELESSEQEITRLGEISLQWWKENYPGLVQKGALLVAPSRDESELTRFASRTRNYKWLVQREIALLEPDLSEQYSKAIYFPEEAHLDPRAALAMLADDLKKRGINIRFGVDGTSTLNRHSRASGNPEKELDPCFRGSGDRDWIVDCRGLFARDELKELRGVRGEMLLIKTPEIHITRPVRLLHPRFPLYIVPRGEGVYMLGATMIESESKARISARSALELLSAAYALHPAFAEAEILETGADLRPAFPDNIPRLLQRGKTLYINGLYRHGFLAAPALAMDAAATILGQGHAEHETMHQRNLA